MYTFGANLYKKAQTTKKNFSFCLKAVIGTLDISASCVFFHRDGESRCVVTYFFLQMAEICFTT